ncbi:putative DNA binding domain-containing protein [Bifidobacterium sp. 64T4]|uniref:RNA-binding domain-containing protein n=1 Tax=Bifidobacterium pongonis TaxID=2834432 RepID=UPI001C599F3B|nr:RNA-binding domain-containing protein [Bifidobacterium pongonis]MBW3095275.1 putative DNA binding domain-containing protein [Bifidobacterium pongonis]
MPQLREGLNVEFKREWSDSAKRTLVAFANTDGGTLYVGIDDDGNAVGVRNPDECMRQVTQAVSNAVRPDLTSFLSIDREDMDGIEVVVVHVQRGTKRPYYLTDKGIRPAGVYIRSGAASIPASESAIIDMIKASSGQSFETALSLQQSLTFNATRNAFNQAGVAFTPASYRTLGMTDSDDAYTNLAWLLSDQCTASIKVAVFQDANKEVFRDRHEFTGSLLQQCEQASAFIGQYNPVTASTAPNMERIDSYAYPPLVVREALLNLIIHRDYGFAGPALISVFSTGMEFTNLGGLPTGLNQRDMMNGISVQRNPKLAEVFYRLRFIEAYGTGIRRIMGAYEHAERQPVFSITDHSFTLVLPRRHDVPVSPSPSDVGTTGGQMMGASTVPVESQGVKTDEDDRKQSVIDYAMQHGSISRAQVEDLTGLAQSAAVKLLRKLVRCGRLTRIGKGPSTRYVIAEGAAIAVEHAE